jgi:hypothetical protein
MSNNKTRAIIVKKNFYGQKNHAFFVAAVCLAAIFVATVLQAQEKMSVKPIDVSDRLELFVDRCLIDKLDGVELRMHEPLTMPLSKKPLPVSYTTVIKDEDVYRAYYREIRKGYDGPGHDGNPGEITCYAESKDGHDWVFPNLDIFDIDSPKGRNVIWDGENKSSHNFSPFLDKRPGVAGEERFKALSGVHLGGGLYAYVSADGTHWEKIQDNPVITSESFAFDSQNVSFWSEVENCYVCYFRSWLPQPSSRRSISRTTSKDFLNWTTPVPTNPNLPEEHLYTSNTHPYFRAPHIYIALPTRYVPSRGSSTDILFMASRAGSTSYDRLFTEAFIRPGLDPVRWGNRSNYVALNVVPTGPTEMSIYHSDGHRYVLRTDGFVSVRAGAAKGDLLTKPMIFNGTALSLNYSTSAAGGLLVEVQDEHGAPIPGFRLDDCTLMVGDNIEQRVQWQGDPKLSALVGKPIRLRFVMTECDLYSFRFSSE